MTSKFSIMTVIFLLAISAAVSGSPVQGKEGVSKEVGYTEPNTTWTYSTVEEILAEIAANKGEQDVDAEGHTIDKRYQVK